VDASAAHQRPGALEADGAHQVDAQAERCPREPAGSWCSSLELETGRVQIQELLCLRDLEEITGRPHHPPSTAESEKSHGKTRSLTDLCSRMTP
jgi:hypothetical protein